MTTVIPNPVMLTVAGTAAHKVGVKIYDNDVALLDDELMSRFVGFYQNGEEVGSISSNGLAIQYNGVNVLKLSYYYDYTFALQLRTKDFPNGDYVAVISHTKDDETENYEVPIRIEVPRASITKNQYEVNRYELNLT